MSNYQFGTYTSTTPRVQSAQVLEKNSAAQTLSKIHQRSATKSPEAPKKSPSKKIKKGPKVCIDTHLKGLLSPVDRKKLDLFQSQTTKNAKKKSKNSKGNRKKSNSPPKELLYSNIDGKKKLLAPKQQIITGDDDPDLIIKQKSNSVKSVSMHQDILNHQTYEMEFADWLSKRVQASSKNMYQKNLGTQKVHTSEIITAKYPDDRSQNEASNLQNVWPESKKNQKPDNHSHRQSLDSPDNVKTAKKHLQNQLSAFSSYNEGSSNNKKDLSLFSGNDKNAKGITQQKPGIPKGFFGIKEQDQSNKKINYKVSPRTADAYASSPAPLTVHNQNILDKKYSLDSHNLRNSENFDLQRDSRGQMRASLDADQNRLSNDPYLDNFPKNYKDKTKVGANLSKESPTKNDRSSNKLYHYSSNPTHEESELPARAILSKHSDPNIFNDLNNYMHLMMNGKAKRSSDSQLKGYSQPYGEGFVLSTRSVLDRHENRFNFHPPTEESEPQPMGPNVKRIHSSSQPNKELLMVEKKSDENKLTDEIISELLKRNNSKDIKVNPNAKFLLLRKQIQEKRNKFNFKSADWNSPDRHSPKHISSDKGSPLRELSPSQPKAKVMEDGPTNVKLYQILNKTKQVLNTYKAKENKWEKEKKLLVAEIKHLRSVIEKI